MDRIVQCAAGAETALGLAIGSPLPALHLQCGDGPVARSLMAVQLPGQRIYGQAWLQAQILGHNRFNSRMGQRREIHLLLFRSCGQKKKKSKTFTAAPRQGLRSAPIENRVSCRNGLWANPALRLRESSTSSDRSEFQFIHTARWCLSRLSQITGSRLCRPNSNRMVALSFHRRYAQKCTVT